MAAGGPGIGLWIAAMMCGAVGMLFLGKQTDEPWDEMARGGRMMRGRVWRRAPERSALGSADMMTRR